MPKKVVKKKKTVVKKETTTKTKKTKKRLKLKNITTIWMKNLLNMDVVCSMADAVDLTKIISPFESVPNKTRYSSSDQGKTRVNISYLSFLLINETESSFENNE